ncbi:cold-shock protein [Litorihabitans aurantiacus]|uniref:Cold-shock protein CspA n=1 Tax=Litorihabitans aurantiacus TaxID=1930061 RepID=A0AA38CV94_9MICO|nr:cold shock domain-containing protein [Litorihabitans aurantiacus]GMA32635.1 cold-shock protein CspA [Litorihabitans aurantiacus]
MPQGVVRWFDTDRGFGFIDLGGGAEDLFIHASEIVGADADRGLREGQQVEFEVGESDRGPQARRVRVTGDLPADSALGVLGTVTWYESTKGYGFLAQDDGTEVFVHSSAIVGGGVVREGQRVAFLVVDGEKGPQADHVLPLAERAGGASGAARSAGSAGSDGADGSVTFFDAVKGFGFIEPDAGGDSVFVHAKALRSGVRDLLEGDRVTFAVVDGDRGPLARDVDIVGGGSRRPSAGAGRGAPAGHRQRPDRQRPDRSAPVRGGSGVVARFDVDRGFGFIVPDAGGDDLFVHISGVRGVDGLQEGDRVRYQVRQSDRGPQADRVELD